MKKQSKTILYELGRIRMEGLKGVIFSSYESAEGLYRLICRDRLVTVICTLFLAGVLIIGLGLIIIGLLIPSVLLAYIMPIAGSTSLTNEEMFLGRKWAKERAVIKKLPAFRTLCSKVRCTQGEALRKIAQFQECVALMEQLRKS